MAATSIVDYLKSSGQDSSLSARANLAVSHGLVGSAAEYISLASQGKNGAINTSLLSKLQTPAPTPAPTTTPTSSPGSVSSAANYNNSTITGSQLEKGSSLPEPTTYANTQTVTPFSDRVSAVAKTTLNSSQLEVDKLRAELMKINEAEQAKVKSDLETYKGQVKDFVGTTAAQDALDANNKKFKVEENIKLYSDIQTKIVDAQQALEVGLIYEKDRPARMKFITGAESTLQKQGLATIGALQGTAAVIKGNLELAKSFGDATVDAIIQDNEMSFKALNVLLDLASNDLVDLKDEERKLVDDRLSAIEEENNRVQSNKDDVLKLMTDYPRAFLAGGVTLLDTKEQALAKMIPQMAADETTKFNLEVQKLRKEVSTASDKDGPAADKQQMLQLKDNGMPYEEAVNSFGDTLSLAWIQAAYGVADPKATTNEDVIKNQYYGQFLNPDGTIKTGTNVSIDSKGNPVVSSDSGGGIWQSIKNWWNS